MADGGFTFTISGMPFDEDWGSDAPERLFGNSRKSAFSNSLSDRLRQRREGARRPFDRLRTGFVLDCCDREVMGHVATTGGITAEDVRDLMAAAVEHRFGRVNRLAEPIGWLTGNGSPYVARDTRRFARDIGLVPRTTPLSSPQFNGMAEAFVRTRKRDYVRVNPRPMRAPSSSNCPPG